MKAIGAVFAVVILIVAFMLLPSMMGGIEDVRTDARIDDFGVTTGVGETTADVVLVAALWQNNLVNVVDITSDLGTDVPLPNAYVPATQTLTVSGLTASDTRTLSVEYEYSAFIEGTPEATTDNILRYWPLFLVLIFIMIAIGIGVSMWGRR